MVSGPPIAPAASRGRRSAPPRRPGSTSARRGTALRGRRASCGRARRSVRAARALHGEAERATRTRFARCCVEPGERGGLRVVGHRVHEPEAAAPPARRSSGRTGAGPRPRRARCAPAAAGRGGREDAEHDLRLAELRSGAAKSRWPASATSSPPPRHCPRIATRMGTGNSSIRQQSAWSDCEHSGAGRRQVLLDAGAEAEVRAFGVEQDAAQRRRLAARASASARRSAAIISASTTLALGRASRSAQQARRRARARLAAGAAHHLPPFALAAGRRLSTSSGLQGVPAASAWRSATKSASRSSLVPSLNARKPVARLGHHVEGEPGARVLPCCAFQASSLGLRSSSIVLRRAVREGEQELRAELLDPLVEQREVHLPALQQRLALRERRAGLRLAVDEAAVLVERGDRSRRAGWRRTCRPPSAPGPRR